MLLGALLVLPRIVTLTVGCGPQTGDEGGACIASNNCNRDNYCNGDLVCRGNTCVEAAPVSSASPAPVDPCSKPSWAVPLRDRQRGALPAKRDARPGVERSVRRDAERRAGRHGLLLRHVAADVLGPVRRGDAKRGSEHLERDLVRLSWRVVLVPRSLRTAPRCVDPVRAGSPRRRGVGGGLLRVGQRVLRAHAARLGKRAGCLLPARGVRAGRARVLLHRDGVARLGRVPRARRRRRRADAGAGLLLPRRLRADGELRRRGNRPVTEAHRARR